MADAEANRGQKGFGECPICGRVLKNMATHIRRVHQMDPSLFSGRKSRFGTKEEREESSKMLAESGRKVKDRY
jgi:uncharacterized C2H2 Zn-finger protein